MATRVRDWAAYDFYGLLGVEADASADDIARAFRSAAKRSHPDATDDPEEAERFKDLAAAYTVLSDRRSRRDYDRVRAGSEPKLEGAATRDVLPHSRWTRKRGWAALIGGIVIFVLGVLASGVTWHLHESDAHEQARFVAVTAQRLDNGDVLFTTSGGQRVETREPTRHGDPTGTEPTVRVRYDPANPSHVVLDSSTFARDITLAIVALKFLIGGAVFIALGIRHLRPAEAVRAAR